MLLCLDVGNTHILGGVFKNQKLITRFRYATHMIGTANQFGMFLINVLQANNIDPKKITATAIASVVPSHDYTIKHTISLYFSAPCYVLQAGMKTGLNIKYKNPTEVGADRIANAIGAVAAFPHKNIIVVDMGTATTLCAINKKHDYLGGAILPGLRLCMESLTKSTAKLTEVDIKKISSYIGRSTKEGIQSGLYYSHLGALKELITGFKHEAFHDEPVYVIGTGGFSQLYEDEKIFNVIKPDLVLEGLQKAFEYTIKETA